MQLPLFAALTKVVRDTAGSCAGLAELTDDEVEDVRLAVDEAFYGMVLIGHGDAYVTVELKRGQLTVLMRAAAVTGASWHSRALAVGRRVLQTLSARPQFGVSDGVVWVHLEFPASLVW